jgi:deoxyribose-phosphate aldolase
MENDEILQDLASRIEHTLLKPAATEADVESHCREAVRHGLFAVCVSPVHVRAASALLAGAAKVVTVAGFPLGTSLSETKTFEARRAAEDGADEVDMVICVGDLKAGRTSRVLQEIRLVREALPGRVLKVIVETALLTREEKIEAAGLARDGGADFVKTSTGFGPGGATVEDVALLRSVVGTSMGVKAAGGIRDRSSALAMLRAGATRIGTSASVDIITGQTRDS